MQWPNEKRKGTQTVAHKKIHIKLKIEQYETTKTGGYAGAPEGLAIPVLLVTHIIPVDKW